ncbi:MAG: tRNA preQ1(34) S-adenosylmethionine ribosyltransferase-isomerase QueA [Waddliaceae bacterium]
MKYNLADYHYHLPEELIAQHPLTPRDRSRLLVVDRKTGNFSEMKFFELAEWMKEGDRLVFNDTKVIPARLIGKRATGGKVEICLVEPENEKEGRWIVLAKPARKLPPETEMIFSPQLSCRVDKVLSEGMRLVTFFYCGDFYQILAQHGKIPLPSYIRREEENVCDAESYQTVFAAHSGAVAAPTAGLHFTENLLRTLSRIGVEQIAITLHVGPGTFRPVRTSDIRRHLMHSERYRILPEAAKRLNTHENNRREICVGTTCCRALESAADHQGVIASGYRSTDIFMYPGYKFNYVQSLLTNFHLPCSTLLMLVSAFAGYDLIMEAYTKAVKDRYRFYSYGDAMLIL